MKYHIFDLAFAKGTSEPVRKALIAQAEEIERLKRRIAELEQALRKCHDALETFASDESAEGWIAIGGILEARKALEGKL